MAAAAHLAFDLALPTEAAGNKLLARPDREIIWVKRLYEKAVGGFYDVVLSSKRVACCYREDHRLVF